VFLLRRGHIQKGDGDKGGHRGGPPTGPFDAPGAPEAGWPGERDGSYSGPMKRESEASRESGVASRE
jgi:hypothetical protein